MPPLYTDISAYGPLVAALMREGFDVLRAQDDGFDGIPDRQVLDRSTQLRRVLFTQDRHFPDIAEERQTAGIPFTA